MKYPIAIEIGSPKKSWGVVVPDLPGCFSAADSGIDEAIENAKEAIERLYKKGLLTQADGGYLTDLGRNCAEHLQSALRILSS